MLRKGQEGHVRAEREVLKSAALVSTSNAPEWIVRLHYSFQDRDNLYLVLEYMGGGDLLNLLIEKDVFEESFCKFYIAEVRSSFRYVLMTLPEPDALLSGVDGPRHRVLSQARLYSSRYQARCALTCAG